MGAIRRTPAALARRCVGAAAVVVVGLIMLAPSAANAAILKRVHSGTTDIASGTAATIALELPDASKAFVVCSSVTSNTSGHMRVTCVLSDNQLTIDGSSGIAAAMTVAWSVAEFESGVTVQRGTLSFPSTTGTSATATLSPAVDCSKSFVVRAGEQMTSGTLAASADEAMTFRAVLGTIASPCGVTSGSTTNTLTVARNDAGATVTAAWQVVTMEGATVVARGLTTLTGGSVNSSTFSPAVEPTAAFAVISSTAGTAVSGVESEYFFRGDFSNCAGTPTTCNRLTFTRVSTTTTSNHQVNVAWEVVRLDDGSSVQRGSTTSSGTTQSMGTAGNISAIDRSAAVPFFTVSGGSGTTNTLLDESAFLAYFAAATEASATNHLQFWRYTSTSQAAVAYWFVVSFFKCANSRICTVDAKAGNATVTVSWSPIYDPRCLSGSTPTACDALVVRDTASISWAPTSGTTYTVGQVITGNRKIVFNGSGTSFTDGVSGLANGTQYFYRVYPKVGATTYITDSGLTTSNSQVSVTPSANVAWSYATTGGPTLNAPIAGDGKVYVGSNGGKIIFLDSATGVPVTTAANANGGVQSYLSWFPVSGGTDEAIVGGDEKGWLMRFDAVTGDRIWTTQLPVDNIGTSTTGYIAGAVSAQVRAYTIGGAQCDGGAFSTTFSHDMLYVAPRENSRTANQVWGVNADTGAIEWTSTPSASMDRAAGQPFVDYCRNRLWVATGNNSGTQKSIWVINTLTGAEVASFSGVGDLTDASPTLSRDRNTVWAGNATGTVYAFDAAIPENKYSRQLSGGVITGFIWEDSSTAGRLYVPVTIGGSGGVWCLQDSGSALTPCADWSVNPRTVTTGNTSQPLVLDSAIFYPGSDGKVYQVNTADGQLYEGTGHPVTLESGILLGGISTEDGTQLFIGTNSGRTFRVDLVSGNLP